MIDFDIYKNKTIKYGFKKMLKLASKRTSEKVVPKFYV